MEKDLDSKKLQILELETKMKELENLHKVHRKDQEKRIKELEKIIKCRDSKFKCKQSDFKSGFEQGLKTHISKKKKQTNSRFQGLPNNL